MPDVDTDSTGATGMGGGPLGCRCSLGGGRILFICRSAVYMFFTVSPSVYYRMRREKIYAADRTLAGSSRGRSAMMHIGTVCL